MPKYKAFEWSITLVSMLAFSTIVTTAVIFVASAVVLQISTYLRLRDSKKKHSKKLTIIGFFHPNCDGGAGGEKVLWSAVQAMQMRKIKSSEKLEILIYSAS